MCLRRASVRSLFALVLLFSSTFVLAEGDGKRVLFVPRGQMASDFMIEKEALTIINGLRNAGFVVEVATVSGDNIRGSHLELKADHKLSELKLSAFDAVVLACMAQGGVGSWHASEDEKQLVREAAQRNMLTAAQSSSIITLAESGLLDGKKYCYYANRSTLSGFQKAEYKGQGVIRDGQLITSSSCPQVPVEYGKDMLDYTKEYVKAIIVALNE